MVEWLSPEEVEEYVLENKNLVHYLIKKIHVAPSEYDDVFQIGMLGLIKAAQTFNKAKDIKFATYASRCINNEILMHLRSESKRVGEKSLDEPINIDNEGNELTLGSIIAGPGSDFVESIEERETFLTLMNIILNLLDSRERLIMLYRMSGDKQEIIAKRLGVTRSWITRIETKTKKKLKDYLDETDKFMQIFKFDVVESLYQLNFCSTDIDLAITLQNLVSISKWQCDICYDGKHITIRIPRNPDYFWYIPELIKEIDNYQIECL